jgi:serine/threonine protein kinase/tetratricopeptide (TPR) repeat protein
MNDRSLHDRATDLFLRARGLSDRDRESLLASECAGDEPLAREVQSLLQYDDTRSLGDDAVDGAAAPRTEWIEPLPTRIGPYRVIERLGRGGSGYVLLAEQESPVRRRVAIKIVPHAAIDPRFAARFEVERRALERTDHPFISRILDAGRTDDGLPYLVMDFIDGLPVTEHCRIHGVPLRARIELMLHVADAVQHAHQRGVIHRDLKPGNILVTIADGRASPRVLDFGIAKPIPEHFGESPPTSGLPVGTPGYMAPEQTLGDRVDTRADVYSLGAVLYELTCGRPPVDATPDLFETLRRIREMTPPPASRARAANHAGFDGDGPSRAFLADLDCILQRAMEKEPSRRYATVAAFADDLRRLLRGEPIVARSPTIAYVASRWARRHVELVTAMGVVAAALVLGVVGLTTGLIEARRQRAEAVTQTEAQREINRFLTEDLLGAASPFDEGENVRALDLLQRAGERVEARLGGRPLIAAAVHHSIGATFMELGAFDAADRHLSRALELRRVHAGPDAPDTVRTEVAAAALLMHRQRLPEATESLTRAVERARRVLGPDDPALYTALNDLGVTLSSADRAADAVAALDEALAGRTRLFGPNDQFVMMTISNLSLAYEGLGDMSRSLDMLIEALRVAEALPAPPPMALIAFNNNIGAKYQDMNRDADAAPYLRRAEQLCAERLGPEHPNTLTIRGNLASLEAELGDPDRGLELMAEVIDVRTRLLGPSAHDTLIARYSYWNIEWIAKRFDAAAAGYLELLPDMERSMGADHWLTAATRLALARAYFDGGRLADALPHATIARDRFLSLYGPDHPRTTNAAGIVERITSPEDPRTNPPD